MLIWGVTSGAAGMVSQVCGVGELLAEKTGGQFVLKTLKRKRPWCWLPAHVFSCALTQLTHDSDEVVPPWPDVVISCGRRSAAFALALKKKTGCKLVHIQNPRISPSFFDLVIAQEHDRLQGENVIETFATLNPITPVKLALAKEDFSFLQSYPSPRMAVLMGGKTHNYVPSDAAMEDVLKRLDVAIAGGSSLLITPSRRTLPEHVTMLQRRLELWPKGRVYIYDGTGKNPYMGLLAHADAIAVTDDSTSMMSEALTSGKPLYLLPWKGHTRSKPKAFAKQLLKRGFAKECDGALVPFSASMVDEKQRVVDVIMQRVLDRASS